MGSGAGILIAMFQLGVYVLLLCMFIPGLKKDFFNPEIRIFFKLTATTGTFFCFAFAGQSDDVLIFPNDGFQEYMILVLTSVISIWFSHFPVFQYSRIAEFIADSLRGVLFILSLLTCYKFIIILPFVLFPILGAMIFVPYIITLICLYEIWNSNPVQFRMKFFRSFLIGMSLLFLIQVIMNLYSENNWELIKLFTLDYFILD
ncbi:MAG: hypothetical protein IPM77_04640 [Crocinitomicaceae bacterium]|nr:hypothetical protein [Crocinitomicaceae bacterium]